MSIKCFFGYHDIIVLGRIFKGYTFDGKYVFVLTGQCIHCGKTMEATQKIPFYRVQKEPYDVNFPKFKGE